MKLFLLKSILKIWINLLFWKSIATASPVFECTFDNGKCPNGDFIFKPSSSVSITDKQFITGHTYYRITDVTSITTPTKNGEICLLPFTEGNYEYYHCYNYFPFGCPTKSGRGECTLGKYVLGKSPSTGAEIDIKGTSSQITLPETGSYELSFYVLMFTNITDMTLGGDYIQVSVNSAVNSSLSYKSEKYDYTNIGKANVWQKKSFKFNAPEENIILVVDFVRLNRAEKVGYFGFDQIEILSSSATSSATTFTTTITTITTSQTTSSTSSSTASTPTSSSTTFSTSTTTITSSQTSTLTSSSTTLSSTTTSTTSVTASQTTFSTSSSSASTITPSSTTLFSTTSSTSTTTITTSQTTTSTTATKLSLSPTFSTKTSGSPSTLTSSSTRFSTATTSFSSSSSKTVSFYTSSKSTRTTYSKNSTTTGDDTVTTPAVISSSFTTTKSASSPKSTSTLLIATTKTTSTELLSSISNSESIKISSTVKTDSFGPSNYPSLILTTLSENLDNSSTDKTWLHYLLGFGTPTLIGFSIGICFYKSCFKSKRRVRNSDSISLHDY